MENTHSILIIDDNADVLSVEKLILEHGGHQVLTAGSGAQALDLLSQIKRPQLILLDMQLGDMSGIDFITQMEEKWPNITNDIPVVFLTGMDEVPKCKAAGFIRKPVDIDSLLESVGHYITH
jgi:two-component system response regulator AtoC